MIDDTNRPGKFLNFTKFKSAQMAPYMGLFDFKADQSYNGTIFRLPFRSHAQGISDVKFDEKEVTKLQNDMRKEGSKLLLFLQNVDCITFSRIEEGQPSPQPLLQVRKNSVSHFTNGPKQKCMHKGEHISLNACMFEVCVTNFQDDAKTYEEHWLLAESMDILNVRVGAVACLLEEQSCDVYSPISVHGEAFCFLPLHDSLKTGLPVQVSANFAVTNDRKAIHSSDSDSANELCEFNVMLMKTCIPQAYHKLLLVIQELCIEGRVAIDDYEFHCLWPLKQSLKTHNPWDHFIPELYQLISDSKLCYSDVMKEWRFVTDCKFLPEDILQNAHREDVKKVVVTLQHPLIELPTECLMHLKESNICLSMISEYQFLKEFFGNIDLFPIATRNNVLLSLIITYANESTYVKEKSFYDTFPLQLPFELSGISMVFDTDSPVVCQDYDEIDDCISLDSPVLRQSRNVQFY